MSRKEPRQLKELRNLMPFAWDTRKEKHPPGVASMRDFQDCFQFSFKSRQSPTKSAHPGQRKRRKDRKVLELNTEPVDVADNTKLAGENEAVPRAGHPSPCRAQKIAKTGQNVPSPPKVKEVGMGTPSCMQTILRTPGSGVSDVTPACRTQRLAGHNPQTMPSHLSAGTALHLSPAGALESSRWHESPPVPTKLLKDATAEEGSGSETMCSSILKSKRASSVFGPLLDAGEAEGLPLDDTASGSGQEREALQSLQEIDTAILLSGTKHVQLPRNPTPPKETSAAACRPLNTERTAPKKGAPSVLVGLPAVHNPAIEMDGTRGAAGKDKEVSAEDGKRAYNSVTGGLGSFIAEQDESHCHSLNQDCRAHKKPLHTSVASGPGASPSEKALLEIKALDIQCNTARPVSRPASALSESRSLLLSSEPAQTCPPLFQTPAERKGRKAKPASTGKRSRPTSAVSVRADDTTEPMTPAGRDAFLFASAVMVLGSHYRVEPKQIPHAQPLMESEASPRQAPCSRGSLLQACALLSTHDAAAGWKY